MILKSGVYLSYGRGASCILNNDSPWLAHASEETLNQSEEPRALVLSAQRLRSCEPSLPSECDSYEGRHSGFAFGIPIHEGVVKQSRVPVAQAGSENYIIGLLHLFRYRTLNPCKNLHIYDNLCPKERWEHPNPTPLVPSQLHVVFPYPNPEGFPFSGPDQWFRDFCNSGPLDSRVWRFILFSGV